jgi:streptomycin 6-kinase
VTDSSPPTIRLPQSFKARIRSLFGQDGSTWLKDLPALRATLLERWSLGNIQPVGQLSYHYLAYAVSPHHGQVVLKIGCPNPELLTEIKALIFYRGLESVVNILDWDIDRGALLLERILPGHNLTSLSNDQEATQIAGNSVLKIRQSNPDSDIFPTMEKWCQGFNRYREIYQDGPGPLPESLFSTAYGLVWELLGSGEDQYFLHGDLHHSNLIFQEDGSWIAIDPKGVIGELACEVGPFLFNPIPDLIRQPNLEQLLSRRLQILAEITSLDGQRLAAWSFCRAVLAAIWSIEEGETNLSYWVQVADLIRRQIH